MVMGELGRYDADWWSLRLPSVRIVTCMRVSSSPSLRYPGYRCIRRSYAFWAGAASMRVPSSPSCGSLTQPRGYDLSLYASLILVLLLHHPLGGLEAGAQASSRWALDNSPLLGSG